jgi:hypothetical protein
VVEFIQQGATIMPEVYCKMLKQRTELHRTIENKRCGILTSGVVLLHDSAHPHTVTCTLAPLEHFKWELFDHLPYSPIVHHAALTCLPS